MYTLASSLVLLSLLSLEHQIQPQLQKGHWLHVLLLVMLTALVPGCCIRVKLILWCQEGIFSKSSCLAPFWRLLLPHAFSETLPSRVPVFELSVPKPRATLQSQACRAIPHSAKLGLQSHTPTARKGIHSAPGTAFIHHLYFVFATSLQVNSRYPACQRLTCCDIP